MIKKHEEQRLILEERKKQYMVLSEYIKLDGNKYVMQISEDKAFELGISKESYSLANDEIQTANRLIDSTLSENGKVYLLDIQKRAIEYKRGINIKTVETDDINDSVSRIADNSGNIYTIGNEPKTSSFRATGSMVRFNCRSAAAILPIYTCTVRINGISNTGTGTGSVFCNKIIDVTVPGSLSGDYGILESSTTDSNGGSCYWKVM